MRKHLFLALAVLAAPLAGALVACGGAQASATVQTPVGDPGAATPDAPASSGASNTTAALGEGDPAGTKLPAAGGAPASSAQPSGPHAHDPGRSAADLRAIITAHRDEARACYDAALKDHPGIEGDLVVQWTIDPKGGVQAISQDLSRSQITEPGVVACVVRVIQKIQFAPSAGGFETKAFYPFNFRARGPKP